MITVCASVNAAPVPVDFSKAWLYSTDASLVEALRRFSFDVSADFEAYCESSSDLKTNAAGLYYSPFKNRFMDLGFFAVSCGNEGFSPVLGGFLFGNENMTAKTGIVGGNYNKAFYTAFAYSGIGGFFIFDDKFKARTAGFDADLKLPYQINLRINAGYYSYLDTVKAGAEAGFNFVPGISLKIGSGMDVFNRGLGFGMSESFLEIKIPFLKGNAALNLRGSYSEELFYEGLWGTRTELAFFDALRFSFSYNDSRDMLLGCAKNNIVFFAGFKTVLSQPEALRYSVSGDDSLISNNSTGESYRVESFLYAKNLLDKKYFKIEKKEKITAVSCAVASAAAGSAVYFSGIKYRDKAVLPSAVLGGMLAYWVAPWVLGLFDN